MKIDVLCGGGSPNGVTPNDLYGRNGRVGVGGSEYALLTLCEGWHNRGHEVTLYNNPKNQDRIFEQRTTESFDKSAERDVLIVNREPNQKAYKANGKVIFFSCDQYSVGDFAHFHQFVDKTVTISPFHTEYFKTQYGIQDSINIDLPVRTWEYEVKLEKVANRLIFTSVPDRGLALVAEMWPRLQKQIPDISLVITSDYRLWGSASPMNEQHVSRFIRSGNVQFLGAVPRERLVEEQLRAQVHFYPSVYPELFCIAVAESQIAGVLPTTSGIGALSTTNMGVVIQGDAQDAGIQQVFVDKTVEYLRNEKLPDIQENLRKKALERFSLDRILNDWDRLVFNG